MISPFAQYIGKERRYLELERERAENIQRIIAYNNRRVRAGLRPLEVPAALLKPSDWPKPTHRDNLPMLRR